LASIGADQVHHRGVIFDDVLHAADMLRGEHSVLAITAPAQIPGLHDGRLAPTIQDDLDL
jgi:hypothetical protein